MCIRDSNDGGDEVGRFDTNGNLMLINDLIIENHSLKAKLEDIDNRISALETAFSVMRHLSKLSHVILVLPLVKS